MLDNHDRTRGQERVIAYRTAINALRKQIKKIATKDEALDIPLIGIKLATKIEGLFFTDTLRRLDNINIKSNDRSLQMFMKIYGVGFAQATAWISQGLQMIEDLLAKAKLANKQLIGIEIYKGFTSRIPRREVEDHDEFVCRATQQIDENPEAIIGGSYFRAAADSDDVDFITTKPDRSIDSLRYIFLMKTVVPRLNRQAI